MSLEFLNSSLSSESQTSQKETEKPSIKQGSLEWLAFRGKHIGASEIAAILGESEYRSAYDVWAEKVGITEPQSINFAMKRGMNAEPIIRSLYEEKTGTFLTTPVLEYKEWPVLSASLDGLTPDNRIVEFKYPSKEKHQAALRGEVPYMYWIQMQQQMLITGSQSGDYVSYDGTDIAIVEVKADPGFQQTLLKAAKDFWALVESKTPPPTDDIQIEDAEMASLCEKYDALKAEIKRLDTECSEIQDRLKAKMPGEKVRCLGFELKFVESKGTVDYAKIPALIGLDLEPYRKPATRRFMVTRKKT